MGRPTRQLLLHLGPFLPVLAVRLASQLGWDQQDSMCNGVGNPLAPGAPHQKMQRAAAEVINGQTLLRSKGPGGTSKFLFQRS